MPLRSPRMRRRGSTPEASGTSTSPPPAPRTANRATEPSSRGSRSNLGYELKQSLPGGSQAARLFLAYDESMKPLLALTVLLLAVTLMTGAGGSSVVTYIGHDKVAESIAKGGNLVT